LPTDSPRVHLRTPAITHGDEPAAVGGEHCRPADDAGHSESASAPLRVTVSGEAAYPDLVTQAAAAACVFLLMNNVNVDYDIDEAEQMVLRGPP